MRGRKLSIPSWVPDLSDAYLSERNYLSPLKANRERLSGKINITPGGQNLSVQGVFLNEIVEVASCGNPYQEALTYKLSSVWRSLQIPIYTFNVKTTGWRNTTQVAKAGAQVAYHVWLLCKAVAHIHQLLERTLGNSPPDPLWKFLLGSSTGMAVITERELEHEFYRVVGLGSRPKAGVREAVQAYSLGSNPFIIPLQVEVGGQSFFIGKNGCYGLSKDEVQKGDRLVLLLFPKQHAPFILRKKNEATFEMVGMVELPPKVYNDAVARVENELVDIQIG